MVGFKEVDWRLSTVSLSVARACIISVVVWPVFDRKLYAQSFEIYLDKVDLDCHSYVRLESSTIILLLGLMAQMVSISDAVLILAIRQKIV